MPRILADVLDEIRLTPFVSEDLKAAFQLYEETLRSVVDRAFGWEDGFQRERFASRYELSWFHWVEASANRVGYVCFFEKSDELHMSLLIIDPKFQGRSFGRKVMSLLQNRAKQSSKRVTLSSFKKNEAAISFYQKLGYQITGEDEHFVDLKY